MHEHTVGLYRNNEGSDLVTVRLLKTRIRDVIEHNEYVTQIYGERAPRVMYKRVYSLSDYADGRKSTNLIRFKNCPYCGEKIDWKKIKEDM